MYRLNLFGGVSIDGMEGPVIGRAVQRHRLALLGILAASLSPGVSRDKLVVYLWPERSAARARHALADSIYRLNEALGGSAVLAVGDQLRLNGAIVRSDVGTFRDAFTTAAWEDAARVYSGPFMDGFFLPGALEFERWLELVRERLDGEYGRALESLAAQRAARGDAAGAVDAWRQRAMLDRYDSRVALRLVEALVAAGNRAAAVRHAHSHTRLVEEELGTHPVPEIASFAERLAAGG
ncbi:MAG TPA: BTAD domain-containing putative transcriptional regulator [Gemmatimonadaceae bacterium]|nr:BTAD domain-containing putative transcriptional regulator [Gemmatimonadaceae bacterium]